MNGGRCEPYEQTAGRLLPWSSPEGKPCYLVGGGTGYVSRRADAIERTQLDMADHQLDHTAELLTEPRVTSEELRYVAGRLRESLLDVKRIAESRAARLERAESNG
jgi:hypothetical protein